jgi:hypothetical protein
LIIRGKTRVKENTYEAAKLSCFLLIQHTRPIYICAFNVYECRCKKSAEVRYKKISKDQKRKAAGGEVEVEGRGGEGDWSQGEKPAY